ncbi:MAG: hypothetical protein ABFS56_13395, partial [Pseudomonadota bacterium]
VEHCSGVRSLVAAAALLFSVSAMAGPIIIDNFKDGTKVSVNNGESLCAEASSIPEPTSAIIGTERDMSITSVQGSVTMDSFFVGLLIIEQETDANIVLQWDGVDADGGNTGPCVLNHTGLGGVDLTVGGIIRKFNVMVSSTSPADTQIDFRIYTDATHWSTYLLNVNSDQITPHVIEHNEFTPAGADGGVDFANVGAIEMVVMVPKGRVSISFDLVETEVVLGETSVEVIAPNGVLPGGVMFMWRTLLETNNEAFIVGQRPVGGNWKALSPFIEAEGIPATYRTFIAGTPAEDVEYGLADIDNEGNPTIHVLE